MNNTRQVKLNNGVWMPQLSFGTFRLIPASASEATVTKALQAGYRSIDTATAYQNETAVGRAVRRSQIPRDQLFLTSKLWVADASYKRAKAGIDASLQRLGQDYLDLYLLHQPYGDVVGAWRALEDAYRAGKIRAIGVSNFYADQVKNLELTTTVNPAVNQIEVNPWYQRQTDIAWMQAEGIQVEAWAPFAEGKHDLFRQPVLAQIGQRYGKTVSQVVLRWLQQREIITASRTTQPDRMAINQNIYDFDLSPADMQQIAQLDRHQSQFFDHRDPVALNQIFGTSLQKLRA